ncbi:MAG: hypothetical protein NVSMB62_03030 [Acidobacteriaceae bacterium]
MELKEAPGRTVHLGELADERDYDTRIPSRPPYLVRVSNQQGSKQSDERGAEEFP